MKTSVQHNHKNSVINYLFFGIAASIFTLSIFFSFYQQNEKVTFYKDLAFISNSRMLKPMSSSITETQPVNLKAMLTEANEAPLAIEPWMTETYTAETATPTSTANATAYIEAELVVEPWMTDINNWTIISSNTVYEEAEMAIESWMLNTEEWLLLSEISPYSTNTSTEEAMHIESWMLNLDSWATTFNDADYTEPELAIESWMLDTSSWLADTK